MGNNAGHVLLGVKTVRRRGWQPVTAHRRSLSGRTTLLGST